MQEDNVYLTSSEFLLSEPAEQAKERDDEKNAVFSELPIINDVAKSLEESIAFYKSIDSVSDDVLTDPVEFMHVVAGNKLAASVLNAELIKLKSLVKEHTEQ